MRTRPGYTLAEMVIALAILATLVGVTSAVARQALQSSEFERARSDLRNDLAKAREDTVSGTNDSPWGVRIATSSITRYMGKNYAQRDAGYDLTTSFGSGITLSGTSDVAFTRPYGIPSSTASIVIQDGSRSTTFTINALGAIDVH